MIIERTDSRDICGKARGGSMILSCRIPVCEKKELNTRCRLENRPHEDFNSAFAVKAKAPAG